MDLELLLYSLERNLEFSFVRSSGKGGQNVNKVSTKAVASVRLDLLEGLDESELELVRRKLAGRISQEGFFAVAVQDTRSQLRNRDLARERMSALLIAALAKPKKRIGTKPHRAAKERRLTEKRARSVTKSHRGRIAAD